MSTLRKLKYQLVSLIITGTGEFSSNGVVTDRNYKKVVGIQLSCNDATAFDNATLTKFEIDAQEIYPSGFPAKLLASGQDVPPNQRFDKEVDEKADNSTFNITYKDNGHTAVPYTMDVILWLENPKQHD